MTDKKQAVSARTVFTDPWHILAFGFGAGLAPVAPGTFGSVVGVLLALATVSLPLKVCIFIAVIVTLAGIPICGQSSRRLGVHDHSGIVWDEIAGVYITLLVVPAHWIWWLVAFLLFRLFDIWKPWPIREVDHRLHGGAGIMLDDLIAALYASIILVFAGWFIH